MDYRKILIPTDFSECAGHALEAGLALARNAGAKVQLLHVVEPAAMAPVALAGLIPEGSILDRIEENARELMDKLVKEKGAGLDIEGTVVVGPAATEIASIAERSGADLIVIATHGRTGLKHTLMGSVAERLLRYAPCPVLVIPTGEHAK